ncbi:hypothetical protein EXIGLDRAFT_838868 [Exidia glandulosa HHB12029]|uniref:F-box domain-containing protein n=1 Tax=Exidia glandulosa HHB12029 TaxID=1314781 RepID=A0A166A6G5_EXIGL|nr:hypothetical protein EXIGLDRAFT_838868 [Exidia glandulosa HHB12029]
MRKGNALCPQLDPQLLSPRDSQHIMTLSSNWGVDDAWSVPAFYLASLVCDADGPLWERHISTLPLELLSASFEHLPLKDLVTATHVCRCWRSAALSHAKLWSHINTSNRDQLVAMLARSRNALLSVTLQVCPPTARLDIRNRIVEGSDSTHEEFLDLQLYEYTQDPISRLYDALLPHMARVHTLHIEDSELTSSLHELLNASAPRLATFSLNIRAYTLDGELQLVLVKGRFFNDDAPHLRSFSICGPKLDPTVIGHATIRSLRYLEFSGGYEGLTDDMLNVLRDVPEVVLHLERYVWASERGSVSSLVLSPALFYVGLDDYYHVRALVLLPDPAAMDVDELVVMDGLVRATVTSTGCIRDIRGLFGDGVLSYTLSTLDTLTRLTVSESVWSSGLDAVANIPNLIELSIQLPYEDGTTEFVMLQEDKLVPRTPRLKRLVLDGRRYTSTVHRRLIDEFDLDASSSITVSTGISSQTLFRFVSRLCAQRPVVTLKGFQLTSMGPNDPSYLGLLDAVDDVECIV